MRALLGMRVVELLRDAPGRRARRVGVAGAGQVRRPREGVDLRLEVGEAQEVRDQAAARVRDQADARAGGQRAGERERVLDRALRERAVLEGVDAAGEVPLERGPQLAVAGAQVAEAAHRTRARAVHEHQHRQPVRHGLGEVGGAGRLEVVGLARRAHPAIKAGLAVELALDRPHQRLGADPADAELERGDALAFEFACARDR